MIAEHDPGYRCLLLRIHLAETYPAARYEIKTVSRADSFASPVYQIEMRRNPAAAMLHMNVLECANRFLAERFPDDPDARAEVIFVARRVKQEEMPLPPSSKIGRA